MYCVFFVFYDTATPEIYTLSLHDALPISGPQARLRRPVAAQRGQHPGARGEDRKSTRLNSSHVKISYAVFCLKKKKREAGGHHEQRDVAAPRHLVDTRVLVARHQQSCAAE